MVHFEEGVFPSWHAVDGHFCDEDAGGFVFGSGFDDEGDEEGHDKAKEVHAGHDEPLEVEDSKEGLVRNKQGDEEDVDGDPGAATHEGGDHDGDEPLDPVGDGAGHHDGRDRTGHATDEGDDGFSTEAEGAHDAVHEEDDPRHVAGIFEDADEEEEEGNLGNEDDDASQSGPDPIDEEIAEPAGGGRVLLSQSPEAPKPVSMRSMGSPAQANMVWKMRKRRPRKMR